MRTVRAHAPIDELHVVNVIKRNITGIQIAVVERIRVQLI
jgi:hypothetical protein